MLSWSIDMYKSEVYGKNGVFAKVVAHSKNSMNGKEAVTLNIKYGLIVHGEFLRHRLISNSVKSNRAIPMKTIRKEVLQDPYIPVWFGAAQKGMVANVEMKRKRIGKFLWLAARYPACGFHWLLEKFGAHKEFANRLLNPWQFVRETITATDFDNLYALRLDKAAQKDIKEVVDCIKKAIEQSTPEVLKPGEWHTPYIETFRASDGDAPLQYIHSRLMIIPEEAVKCSAARCARSSYDKHDSTKATLAEDLELYESLLVDSPVHASPAEHQLLCAYSYNLCTILQDEAEFNMKQLFNRDIGWSHIDKECNLWSGNSKGWIQLRKTLANEAVWEYNPPTHNI